MCISLNRLIVHKYIFICPGYINCVAHLVQMRNFSVFGKSRQASVSVHHYLMRSIRATVNPLPL